MKGGLDRCGLQRLCVESREDRLTRFAVHAEQRVRRFKVKRRQAEEPCGRSKLSRLGKDGVNGSVSVPIEVLPLS